MIGESAAQNIELHGGSPSCAVSGYTLSADLWVQQWGQPIWRFAIATLPQASRSAYNAAISCEESANNDWFAAINVYGERSPFHACNSANHAMKLTIPFGY